MALRNESRARERILGLLPAERTQAMTITQIWGGMKEHVARNTVKNLVRHLFEEGTVSRAAITNDRKCAEFVYWKEQAHA